MPTPSKITFSWTFSPLGIPVSLRGGEWGYGYFLELHITVFSAIILGTALQLKKSGQTLSSFSLRPLLPSVAVEDRNSFSAWIQPWITKNRPLIFELNWARILFNIWKTQQRKSWTWYSYLLRDDITEKNLFTLVLVRFNQYMIKL